MTIKSSLNKQRIFFALSLVCLLCLIAFAVILFGSLMVRPDKISLSADVNVVYAGSENTYYGLTDGTIEYRDTDSGELSVLHKFDSKIVLLQDFGDTLAVATEDRNIWLLDGQGEVTASVSVNYNPACIYSADGKLFVAGSTNVNRNRVYCFDENLQFVDLTEGVSHEEQGENESDKIYQERINSLFLEIPVVSVGYLPQSESLYVLSAYGIINVYDAAGELKDVVGLDYNPSAGVFLSDGTFVFMDDTGGVGAYDANLAMIFYKEELNSANGALAVNKDSLIVSDINGNLTQMDFSGEILLEQKIQGKVEGICLSDDAQFSIWVQSSSVVNTYNWNEMRYYTLYVVLAYVTVVLLVIATGCTALGVVGFISQHKFRIIAQSAKNTGKKMYAGKVAYLLLIPTLFLCLVFAYYPAIKGLILAFFEVDIGGVNTFVGLKNFQDLLSKTYFWSGMGNMVVFLVTDILKGLVPAFIFAQLIIAMRSSRAQYATRVLLYLPGVIPGVAALLMWQTGIFGNEGLLNGIITAFGGQSVNFLGQEGKALTSLIFFGFPWIGSYIILYGALVGVPKSFYDAAKLDGCSWVKRMLWIDLPLISPQLKYIFVITFIGSVQDFQRVYLTTEGAAGTYVPMLEMYYNLTKFNNLGMAAAMGLILFLILMIATLINLKLKTVDSYE